MDLTDDEKLILELWPMYEDGSRVMPGDRAISNVGAGKGEEFEVLSVRVNTIGVALTNLDGAFWIKKPGERVKRPDQEVLDADGVPIEKGDTVHGIGRSQHEFKVLDPRHVDDELGDVFSVKCYDMDDKEECHCRPDLLTHKRPALDADGVLVKVGDTVWYKNGRAHGIVESVDSGSLMNTVRYRSEDGTEYRDAAKDLAHRRPVLDAYGCPIEVGETVFNIITGAKLLVESVGPMFVDVRYGGLTGGLEPNLITHSPLGVRRIESGEVAIPMANGERHVVLSVDAEQSQDMPDGGAQDAAGRSDGGAADSWEQILDDASMDVCDYFCPKFRDCYTCRATNDDMECEEQRTMELKERVKKLVETGGLQ